MDEQAQSRSFVSVTCLKRAEILILPEQQVEKERNKNLKGPQTFVNRTLRYSSQRKPIGSNCALQHIVHARRTRCEVQCMLKMTATAKVVSLDAIQRKGMSHYGIVSGEPIGVATASVNPAVLAVFCTSWPLALQVRTERSRPSQQVLPLAGAGLRATRVLLLPLRGLVWLPRGAGLAFADRDGRSLDA